MYNCIKLQFVFQEIQAEISNSVTGTVLFQIVINWIQNLIEETFYKISISHIPTADLFSSSMS